MATASPLGAPAPWTNQSLILYHGTVRTHLSSLRAAIDVQQGRVRTDFGQGFYTTTWLEQAQLRAWQLSLRQGGAPVVLQLDVDREALASLDGLWFVRGGLMVEDFWSFVHHCRGGLARHGRSRNDGWYDLVAGPLVASWKQRLIVADADQISFHTARAARLLDASPRQELPVP
jgi:hypothetical protein